MDVYELLQLLEDWIESKPIVRGYEVSEAGLRLDGRLGRGRLVVALKTKNPQTEFQALGEYLIEQLRQSDAKLAGEDPGEPPLPPNFPTQAYARFNTLVELVQILDGEKEAEFFLHDEEKWVRDSLHA